MKLKLTRVLTLDTMFRSDDMNFDRLNAVVNALREYAINSNVTIDDYSDGTRAFGFARMLEEWRGERSVSGWVFGYGCGCGCGRYTHPILFAMPDNQAVLAYADYNVRLACIDDYFTEGVD